MPVACRTCRLQFSPSLGDCPGCGRAPPIEDQREFLVNDAVARLRDGTRRQEIRGVFVARGLSDADADDVVSEGVRRWRGGNRQLGDGLIIKGAGLLVLSALIFAVPLPRGYRLVPTGIAAVGLAMSVVGVIMKVTGWNLDREGSKRARGGDAHLERPAGSLGPKVSGPDG